MYIGSMYKQKKKSQNNFKKRNSNSCTSYTQSGGGQETNFFFLSFFLSLFFIKGSPMPRTLPDIYDDKWCDLISSISSVSFLFLFLFSFFGAFHYLRAHIGEGASSLLKIPSAYYMQKGGRGFI